MTERPSFHRTEKRRREIWPGRALSFRSRGTMNRIVFESEVCGVMLANLRISGPDDACTGTGGAADLALAAGVLAGRRIMRASMPKHIAEMKPTVLLSN